MSRPRAWVYIRESKDELLHGYSPGEMVKQCRAKAELLGAEVVRVIVEEGKRDEINCPGLLEMVDAARARELEMVISYDMMRLTGDIVKHAWFRDEVRATAATVHYVTAEYAETPEGDLQELIQGGFGRYERLKIRARTLNGINGKLSRQQPICNGRTPYGLEKVYDQRGKPVGWAPKEPEISVLRAIVQDLQTMPSQQICDALNAAGTPTPSGRGFWRTGTISSLLENKAYRGIYEFGTWKKTAGRSPDGKRRYDKQRRDADDPSITRFAIDPVIPLADFAAAREAIGRRKLERRPHYAEDEDPYSLRGRLVCGYGHGRLSCVPSRGLRYYVCPQAFGRYAPKEKARRCRLPVVPAPGIEAAAWDQFVAATRDPDRVEVVLRAAADPDGQAERYARQVAAGEAELAKVTQRIVNSVDLLREVGKGSVAWEHTQRGIALDEQTAAELREGLERLRAEAPVVMTEADIAAMLEAWADLAAGIAVIGESAAEQRAVYRRLQLRGTVVLDADGIRLGAKHRFGMDWTWGGRLLGDSKDPCGILLLHTTQRGLAVLRSSDPDAVSWLEAASA